MHHFRNVRVSRLWEQYCYGIRRNAVVFCEGRSPSARHSTCSCAGRWNVLKFGELINTLRASLSDRRLVIKIWPFNNPSRNTHQKPALQRSCTPSQHSCRARASFLCRANYRNTRLQPLQRPRRYGKGGGAHSVPQSGVEQWSFAHTVLLLGALPFTSK